MMHHPPLKARDEKAGSSRWHNLKDGFRYLFDDQAVNTIEDWYNLVASQRHRESFREIAKSIQQTVPATQLPQDGSHSLQEHRAAHMMQLYGQSLSEMGKAKSRAWLLQADSAMIDKFRDVFTAIGKAFAVRTTTKEAYVQRPVTDPVNKDGNRRKIDWNSQGVADSVRSTTKNPMAGERLPLIGGARSSAGTSETGHPAAKDAHDGRPAKGESPVDFDAQCDNTFNTLHDRQRQNHLEGVYTVTADGCTVYQPKQRAGVDNTRERVVATFQRQNNWVSTTRGPHQEPWQCQPRSDHGRQTSGHCSRHCIPGSLCPHHQAQVDGPGLCASPRLSMSP
jgi:hypothetical protein